MAQEYDTTEFIPLPFQIKTYPITISPRPALTSPGPGPAPRGLGANRRGYPAQAPCRRRATARPRAPGASALRPPSAAPSTPLVPHVPPSRVREQRALSSSARGAPGQVCAAHGRGCSYSAQVCFALRILQPRKDQIPAPRGNASVPSAHALPPPVRVASSSTEVALGQAVGPQRPRFQNLVGLPAPIRCLPAL